MQPPHAAPHHCLRRPLAPPPPRVTGVTTWCNHHTGVTTSCGRPPRLARMLAALAHPALCTLHLHECCSQLLLASHRAHVAESGRHQAFARLAERARAAKPRGRPTHDARHDARFEHRQRLSRDSSDRSTRLVGRLPRVQASLVAVDGSRVRAAVRVYSGPGAAAPRCS